MSHLHYQSLLTSALLETVVVCADSGVETAFCLAGLATEGVSRVCLGCIYIRSKSSRFHKYLSYVYTDKYS